MSEERDDLRGALSQALADDVKASEEAAAAEPAPAEPAPETGQPAAPAEGEDPSRRVRPEEPRRPAAEDKEAAPAEEEPAPSEVARDTGPQGSDLAAPAEWSAGDKERFGKLDPSARKFVTDYHQRVAPQLARAAALERDYGQIDQQFFTPELRQALMARGRTPSGTMNDWAAAETALNTPHAKGRMAALIIRAYGIDTAVVNRELQAVDASGQFSQDTGGTNGGGNGAAGNDPYDARIRALETAMWDAESARSVQQVRAWIAETNKDGTPKHPHYPALERKMFELAGRDQKAGKPIDLEALYTEAAWSEETVRKELLQSEFQARDRDAEAERRRRTSAARHAGSSVHGAAGPGGPAPNGAAIESTRDIRSLIKDAMAPRGGGRV